MNTKSNGWGLSTMLLMVAIIIIALLTATFFSIRINSMLGKKNNKSETKLQKVVNQTYYIGKMNDISMAAINYIADKDIDLTYGKIKIDLKELIKSNYTSTIKDSITGNICEGYAECFMNDNGTQQVNSFLKCDSYTTPNY